MANKMEERYELDFDALSSLPGGSINYMDVVEQVLRDLSNRSKPMMVDVEKALTKDQVIAPRSMTEYIYQLQRMSLIVRHNDESVTLTPLGRSVLDAPTQEERVWLVADLLLRRCAGMAEVLAVYKNTQRSLALKDVQAILSPFFPRWKDASNFKQRILWLVGLGCLVKTGTRRYAITEFGRQMLNGYASKLQFPGTGEIEREQETDELDATSIIDESEDLIDELQAASVDSEHHRRLEKAVAACARFLGYQVILKGQPGMNVPDLVISAPLPASLYRVVIDTKSRMDGHLSDLDVLTVVEYRVQHNAEHAVVVAGSFADGKMVRHAHQEGVVLLTVGALGDWVRLHAATPLSLAEYEAIFTARGIVEALPESIMKAAQEQRRQGELMATLVFYLQDAYGKGLDMSLTVEQIQILLFSRLDEKRFSVEEIKAVLEFLCSPVNNGLQKNSTGGFILRMNHDTLMRRMRTLADLFEACYENLSKGVSLDEASDGA